MKVRIVESVSGERSALSYASSYVVERAVAIDAGCLGSAFTPEEQARIRHVFLTHSHMDHIASLPVFLENVFHPQREAVTVHAPQPVLDSIQEHIFNDVIWPDFVRITKEGPPLLKVAPVSLESPIQIGPLCISAVEVNHVVPTYGYLVGDGESTVVFSADTGPTERIWELARSARKPLTVFLEASFPDAMESLARTSGHLTPATFAEEVKKLPADTTFVVTHIKAAFYDRVVSELQSLDIPKLIIGEPGREYDF